MDHILAARFLNRFRRYTLVAYGSLPSRNKGELGAVGLATLLAFGVAWGFEMLGNFE